MAPKFFFLGKPFPILTLEVIPTDATRNLCIRVRVLLFIFFAFSFHFSRLLRFGARVFNANSMVGWIVRITCVDIDDVGSEREPS